LISSTRLPVGSSAPHDEPGGIAELDRHRGVVPGTPSIFASPS
jgi:hypothetical protein